MSKPSPTLIPPSDRPMPRGWSRHLPNADRLCIMEHLHNVQPREMREWRVWRDQMLLAGYEPLACPGCGLGGIWRLRPGMFRNRRRYTAKTRVVKGTGVELTYR